MLLRFFHGFAFFFWVVFDFPGGSDGKASVYNAGDLGSIPLLGRFPGEGNGNPLQYSCLENPMEGGAWCPWGHKELDTIERLCSLTLLYRYTIFCFHSAVDRHWNFFQFEAHMNKTGYEHLPTNFSVNMYFHFSYLPRNWIAESWG